MALATQADVEVALGRSLTTEEAARADFLLRRASAMVVSYLGCDPTDPDTGDVPQDVIDTVSAMVARVYERAAQAGIPLGATQVSQGVGPFSQGVTFGNGGNSSNPWWEKADKVTLKPYRCGGGMVSMGLGSEQSGRYREPYGRSER